MALSSIPWRVVQCRALGEIVSATALAQQGYEVFCPRYEIRQRNAFRLVPFIHSYVFIQFDAEDPAEWHRVKDTKGVLRILNGLVDPLEIEDLKYNVGYDSGKLSEEARAVLAGCFFKAGDQIIVNTGMLEGKTGTIVQISKDFLSCRLKTALLGREVIVNQPLAWLKLVAPAIDSDGERVAARRSPRRQRRLRTNTRPISREVGIFAL